MMITVKLFSIPKVSIENKQIIFSLKKAEALFYYLVVKKECSKDEIINLLWEDKDDHDAKRNLRNALYELRKTFNADDIIISKGSSIYLNPNLNIISDLDSFTKECHDSISYYTGEFLSGFYVKQSLDFEDWLEEERTKYQELYICKLYKRIESSMTKNAYESIEQDCKAVIACDKFDEKAYRILMKAYSSAGSYTKSINLYNQLVETLNHELGISPDPETKKLFDEIILNNSSKNKKLSIKNKRYFFGREKELSYLQNNLSLFLKDHSVDPVIIYGEAGIGKSRLCEEFLTQIHDDGELHILKTHCYQEDEAFYLKSWNNIAANILDIAKGEQTMPGTSSNPTLSYIFSDLNTQSNSWEGSPSSNVENIKYSHGETELVELLCYLAEKKKIILFFEDIQWLDKESFILLINLLKKTKNIYFIATCRNINNKKVSDFTTFLGKYTSFYQMELSRFTKDETIDFAKTVLKGYNLAKINYDAIFHESEGNPFFLDQIFINIRENGNEHIDFSKIQNVLKCRLLDISGEGIKLLNIISIFYDEVGFDMLIRITQKDELELLDIIEELKQKHLITEMTVSNKLFIKFTHEKLREFIYFEQPDWKRRILHNKIGLILEELYKNQQYDHIISSKLIYHFKNSGDLLLELKYTMYYLIYLLEIKLEFYYEDTFLPSYCSLDSYLNKKEMADYFSQIKNMINTMKSSSEVNTEILQLEIAYLYISGRYYVLKGEYAKGVKRIEQMLKMAEMQNNFEYIIKGYKIMIFYAIQAHDKSVIEPYVKKGLKLLEIYQCEDEKCLFIRYQGLSHMMKGDFKEAQKSLLLSTRLLKKLCYKDRINYTHLAMNYYYLGELKRLNLNFTQAINYFEEATNIYLENNMGGGLGRFKTKAGQAAFDAGNYSLAKKYFEESLTLYEKSEMCWARPIAEGYLALIYVYNHQYTQALKCLKHAERYSSKMKNPYEEGILNRIKAEIKLEMYNNQKLNKIFSIHLDLDFEDYYNEGANLLNMVSNCYERDILERFKSNMN